MFTSQTSRTKVQGCQPGGTVFRYVYSMNRAARQKAALVMLPFEQLRDTIQKASPETRCRLRDWMDETFDNAGFRRAAAVERVSTEPVALDGRTYTDVRRTDVFWIPSSSTPVGRTAGIYAFASGCDWLYVGFSCDVAGRRTSHMAALRHDKHPNRLLQRYWDADEPMWFILLEILPLEKGYRRQGQHPAEIQWKRRLRPVCDRESRNTHVSFLVAPYSPSTKLHAELHGAGLLQVDDDSRVASELSCKHASCY